MEIKLTIDNEDFRKIIKEALVDALREEKEKQGAIIEDNELLTQTQAAELLQVTKTTLIRWQKMGDIAVVRVGRAVRYRKSDVLGLQGKKESEKE